jgi:hypothetical protein
VQRMAVGSRFALIWVSWIRIQKKTEIDEIK